MVQGVQIEDGHLVNVNPSTGTRIEPLVRVSTPADVDAAVAAARAAQPQWAARSLAERTRLVREAVVAIGADKPALARTITTEMGKILKEAEEEVDFATGKDEFCELVRAANEPEIYGGSVLVRQPHGVVSICSPWNYPVDEILILAVPALIAGNAVVIKPSEVAPLSGAAAARCLTDGLGALHPGLVGLVQGDGAVGALLVGHAGVDMCCLTGSSATGAKILQQSAATLKPVVLECGGKDPMVVFADADLDAAARDAVDYSFANCGQVCCAVERVYVEATAAAAFEERVLEHARRYVATDGLLAGSSASASSSSADPADSAAMYIGPMVSDVQRQTVHRHVQAARRAGARVLLGGEMPPASAAGTFYPPTVLADVPHAAEEVTQEETFGPVVALSTFDGDEESAVALANDSTYGLTAAVYSGDLLRAGRVAARISAGQIGINNNPFCGSADARCPFVGHKRSGYGSHSGRDGWRQFSVPKSLVYATPPPVAALPLAPPPASERADELASWAAAAVRRSAVLLPAAAVCCAAVAMVALRGKRN